MAIQEIEYELLKKEQRVSYWEVTHRMPNNKELMYLIDEGRGLAI